MTIGYSVTWLVTANLVLPADPVRCCRTNMCEVDSHPHSPGGNHLVASSPGRCMLRTWETGGWCQKEARYSPVIPQPRHQEECTMYEKPEITKHDDLSQVTFSMH